MASMKKTAQDRVIDGTVHIVIALFAVFCIIPFLLVVATSFTDEAALLANGFKLWPSKFSVEAYKLILSTDKIFNAYKVSIFVTVVGTFFSMVFSAILAYPLSVKTLKYRTGIAFFVYFTMLFSGGLVPTYLLISKYLHMKDTLWVLIIPGLISPWNMFMLRNFFNSIPPDLSESARIDGANDILILLRIILPVSIPGIATISLFYALGYWNAWFNAMLYITKDALYPLQYLIMNILRNIQFMSDVADMTGQSIGTLPANTVRMATTVLTIGPIIFVYPFIQRYFTSGMMVGAIKG
jgi:putative aldouronate transport system permease protein